MGSPLRLGVQPLLFAQRVNSNVQPIPGRAAMGIFEIRVIIDSITRFTEGLLEVQHITIKKL